MFPVLSGCGLLGLRMWAQCSPGGLILQRVCALLCRVRYLTPNVILTFPSRLRGADRPNVVLPSEQHQPNNLLVSAWEKLLFLSPSATLFKGI